MSLRCYLRKFAWDDKKDISELLKFSGFLMEIKVHGLRTNSTNNINQIRFTSVGICGWFTLVTKNILSSHLLSADLECGDFVDGKTSLQNIFTKDDTRKE